MVVKRRDRHETTLHLLYDFQCIICEGGGVMGDGGCYLGGVSYIKIKLHGHDHAILS